jgi:DNA polymerase
MLENRERLQSVLRGRLESLHAAGVQQLPKPRRRAAIDISPQVQAADVANASVELSAVASPPAAERRTSNLEEQEEIVARKNGWSRGAETLFEDAVPSGMPASTAATLAILRQEVAPCTRCGELAATRTQTVFGVGNPRAKLCFLGEAPGADEDRLGEPFVGRGGQLLNKIIEACRLKREDVYILNMLKCRPPGNRNPLPDELTNCRPYLERQLELIEPDYICCLGAVASQNLLGTTTPIGKLRGKFHGYRGAKVVCTFHPAYLLRNPAAKKDCWEDMKFLMREMGVEL